MAGKRTRKRPRRAGAENNQAQPPAITIDKRGHVSEGGAGAQPMEDQMLTRGQENPFPLLKLPAELRNEIYRLVLCQGRIVVQITSGEDEAKSHPHDSVPTRALTQVCRQIRKETLPIYFNENKFSVRSDFRSSPSFWSFEIANKYNSPQEVSCLKFWLEKRMPAENLCDLKQITLPWCHGSGDFRREEFYGWQTVAENDFWGSDRAFFHLDLHFCWFAEFLWDGMEQLVPSSVLLQPMRETTADCVPASLFDKWVAAYTNLAQAAMGDPATNLVRRSEARDLWLKTLAPEERALLEEPVTTLKNHARVRQGSQ